MADELTKQLRERRAALLVEYRGVFGEDVPEVSPLREYTLEQVELLSVEELRTVLRKTLMFDAIRALEMALRCTVR